MKISKAEYKHIEIAELRAFIEDKLQQLLEQNHTRTDFAQRLQEIIDKYNSGSSSADAYYEDLVQYVGNIREESERHIREGLSEDELEIYDLLKRTNSPEPRNRE